MRQVMKKYLKKNWFERMFLRADNVLLLELYYENFRDTRDVFERIIEGRAFVQRRGHYSVLS